MELKNIIEVLLFSSSSPLPAKKIVDIIGKETTFELNAIIDEINLEYKNLGKGLSIKNIAGGYQILSDKKYHVFIEKLFKNSKNNYLSRPALEALSVVAYRQPVTRAAIEMIRGVECGSVINTLITRGLIKIRGRSKDPGRPLLFVTTAFFLEFFGLNDINDLPRLKEMSEILGDNNTLTLFKEKNASK
tara:strand:- start:527 stop:1093 length:567 start_codon:yes stop_codon:yes gene_type:complete